MFEIQKLNNISPLVESTLGAGYTTTMDSANPDAIVVRSFKMHDMSFGTNLQAVARAGAGVNNIPIDALSERGVVVFNTPGANANAVKELVLCAMLCATRNVVAATQWTQLLRGQADIAKQVEDGKKKFVGREIMGKTLGVIGLGAIGGRVANAAAALGMHVLGYDPFASQQAIDSLADGIVRVEDVTELYAQSDFITLHVAYTPATKNMLNAETFAITKCGAVIINCARGELVDNAALLNALSTGAVSQYFTDFPCEELLGVDNVIPVPHLGASTPEAEDNCATMAAAQLRDYLENGNIVNSVNFPRLSAPRAGNVRYAVLAKKDTLTIEQISVALAKLGAIVGFSSNTNRDYMYCICDMNVSGEPAPLTIEGAVFTKVYRG